MLIAQYDVHAVFEENAVLPEFKGSTFRGAFGWALKQVVCPMAEQDCRICMLHSRCLYPTMFEPPAATTSRGMAPHPYCLIPPTTRQRAYARGEAFDFSLLLLGPATNYIPYFVAALERMGKTGIGVGGVRPRARFRLQTVCAQGQRVYDAREPHTVHPAPPTRLDIHTIPLQPAAAVEVRWRTPVRLKTSNHLAACLPFGVLIRAILRRISSLFAAFGDGEPALDYQGLCARADAVHTARHHLTWVEQRRFSSRQEREMLLGGLQGTVLYRGDLTEFTPLLAAAQILRVGKQTTFGLGWMEYQVVE